MLTCSHFQCLITERILKNINLYSSDSYSCLICNEKFQCIDFLKLHFESKNHSNNFQTLTFENDSVVSKQKEAAFQVNKRILSILHCFKPFESLCEVNQTKEQKIDTIPINTNPNTKQQIIQQSDSSIESYQECFSFEEAMHIINDSTDDEDNHLANCSKDFH